MQKIFDTDNKEDMDLLWSILPDKVTRLEKDDTSEGHAYNRYYANDFCYGGCQFININWHDKTEITRPVNYEDMIGCVGWVGNSRDARDRIGILNSYYKGSGYPFETTDGDEFAFFIPAKKSELTFYGEDK